MRVRLSVLSAVVIAAVAVSPAWGGGLVLVDADNCPGPGDGSPRDPFCSIQDAIDAALPGDEIVVAPGAYPGAIDLSGKAVTLRSGDGAAMTVIDGLGAGPAVSCVSGEGPDTVIEGFTVTGGLGTDAGGMLNVDSSPTVRACVFQLNTATVRGGGMGNYGASPMVIDCTFLGNAAAEPSGIGGGMHNSTSPDPSSPFVAGCHFEGNTAVFGAGMNNEFLSDPVVFDCTFAGNTASSDGGGMRNSVGRPVVVQCRFEGNVAQVGAGMYSISESDARIARCTFDGNIGDGMFNGGSSPDIFSCLFVGNSGAAVSSSGRSVVEIANCTIVDNEIGIRGFQLIGSPDTFVASSIIWGNLEQIVEENAETFVRFSAVEGDWPGLANIDDDPMFVDAAAGNYRLMAGSKCIDRGDNTRIPFRSTDLDNGPRLLDDPASPNVGLPTLHSPLIDLGAYEFVP